MLDLNDALTADELEALAAAEAQGSGRATKPNRIPFRDVPSFLRDINEQRFCLWKWVKGAKGKWTKPPFGAAGYTISNKKPGGWLTHDQALNVFRNGHGFHGIGMMLLDLKGYGFLDLDDCREPETGRAAPWAQEIIDRARSYTELTPSGTGFRVIGTVPENFRAVHTKVPTRDDGHVEVYANCATGRYITITGQRLGGTLENIADLSALINELTPPQEKEKQPAELDFNRTAEDFTEANLPGDLIDIIQKGAPEGQRSETFYHAVGWLKDLYWPLGEVVQLLEYYPEGIAEKYLGRVEQEARRAYEKTGKNSADSRSPSQIDLTSPPGDPWAKYAAPDLPKDILPKIIEDFAEHESLNKGVQFHGPAMAALTVCAAAMPDHVRIKVKVHEPWFESSRLWTALIGPVSAKKSPIMRAAMAQLKKTEKENIAKWKEAVEQWEQEDKNDRGSEPAPPQRHVLNDVTVEAAGKIFAENDHGLLVERDEMSGWFGAMDKYSSGKGAAADRGFWLTAFNGGSFTVDRISRGFTHISNLSASVLGGIQPDAIRRIMADAVDDGLIQRLIPVILSPAGVGEDVPAGNAVTNYDALLYRLTKLPKVGAPPPDNPFDLNVTRRHAEFDSDAQEIRRKFERHTNKLTQLEAISPQFAAFCGKLDGNFARSALTFHCVEHINLASQLEAQRIPERVSADTATRVDRLMRDFVIPHALHFYLEVAGETPVIADARSIAGYILAHRIERVTFGDLTSNVRCCRKKTRDDVLRMMEPLEMMNWVEREGLGPIPRAWKVNPAVHNTFAAKAAKERKRRDEAHVLLQDLLETHE